MKIQNNQRQPAKIGTASVSVRQKNALKATVPMAGPGGPMEGGWRPRAGFTLVEILVVVAIIGILAATIIPQFVGTKQEARVGAAKGHIAELQSAIERFNVNMDRYPTMDEGLKVLVDPPSADDKKWRGPYIQQLRPDPWGNPYQYRIPGVHRPSTYDLWSRGADGQDGGEGDNADIGNWE